MDIAWIMSGGFIAIIFGLLGVYWRSHKVAKITQASLKNDLKTLNQTAQKLQFDLE
jgi:hypothetical protein